MGKPPSKRRGGGRGGYKTSSDEKGSSSGTTGKYRAPTVGYEDHIFSHGNTKAAAVFTATLTKLARMVALKNWAGATVAGRAMERMKEPTLKEPTMPSMVDVTEEEYVNTIKGENGDPDRRVTRTREKETPKDPAIIATNQAIWMIHYKQWIADSAAWKTNRAKIFALVLEHCPPDLEEVLKTLSVWEKVHDEQDAIELLMMVRNVAMDQTVTKQTVMSYMESSYELFTFHQDKHTTLDNYSIMFRSIVDSIKAHGGRPWHHPKLAKELAEEIGVKMLDAEPSPCPQSRLDEIIMAADKKGEEDADEEMLACQFILGADNGRFC